MQIIKTITPIVLLFMMLISKSGLSNTTQTAVKNGPDIKQPRQGDSWIAPCIDMEFIFVPGGCFQMGSNSGDIDEKPVHKVCLNGFWIGKYEVTQDQWVKIMGDNPSRFQYGMNYPVEQVTWNDVNKFILKLNKQTNISFSLPSEAQWEYAARSGGMDQTYAGGDGPDDVAWYRSNSKFHTHEIGTLKANGLGIYDMSGNVSEWCKDIYKRDAYLNQTKTSQSVVTEKTYIVHRGGSYIQKLRYIRTSYRQKFTIHYRYADIGFRLILPHIQ